MNMKALAALMLPLLGLTAPSGAQSLFQRPVQPVSPAALPMMPVPQPAGAPASSPTGSAPTLNPSHHSEPTQPPTSATPSPWNGPSFTAASLAGVKPPPPKTYVKHDKIEIIINETSLSTAESKLETKTKYDSRAELAQFPSLKQLLYNATLRDGITGDSPNVGLTANQNYKGDGKLERKDRLTAHISGIVIDVKPNGHLVVEAKETIQQDSESKTLVVAGVCDPKDVTVQGTVLSNQVANLVIRVDNTGQVRDASQKGLIPQVLEAIFNF